MFRTRHITPVKARADQDPLFQEKLNLAQVAHEKVINDQSLKKIIDSAEGFISKGRVEEGLDCYRTGRFR